MRKINNILSKNKNKSTLLIATTITTLLSAVMLMASLVPMTTVKKHRQAYRTAGILPLVLLIVSMLTVPVMLFSAPLAAADVKSDCEKDGGTFVVNAAGEGHCFVTIEPDCHKLPPGEVVPDPELCLKPGGIANDPIFDVNDISAEVEDTLEGILPVIADGDPIRTS